MTFRSRTTVIALLICQGVCVGGAANANDFECFADTVENEICLVAPPDARQSVDRRSKSSSLTVPATGMVSRFELAGAAAGPEVLIPVADDFANTKPFVTAFKGEESLRGVETFLKAGPSSINPDIRVSTTGRKPR